MNNSKFENTFYTIYDKTEGIIKATENDFKRVYESLKIICDKIESKTKNRGTNLKKINR